MIIVLNPQSNRYKIFDLNTGGTSSSTINSVVTNAANVGDGHPVYSGKTNNTLYFKTLVAGDNITITDNSTGITISSSGGGATEIDIIGSGATTVELSGDTYIVNSPIIDLTPIEEDIIYLSGITTSKISTATNGLTKIGDNIVFGGILTGETKLTVAKSLFVDDPTFNSGIGFDNQVDSLVIQSDDKIVAGGNFTSYSGVSTNYVIRLNADGSVDDTFVTGEGFDYIVTCLAIQSDHKILVGGYFSSYSGVSANYIIRLNADGSVDDTFVTGSGFDNTVLTITLQVDDKILVGGTFTSYSGVSSNYIIRLNADGSVDDTFVTGSGFDNQVDSLVIQSDDKIVAGGSFTTYGGVTANYIIRLNPDGSVDNTFVTGSGFDNGVLMITRQPDDKILVGGYFTSYSGTTANRFIRLNANGSIDDTFISGSGFDDAVLMITLQPDNKILVGGYFNSYSGVSSTNIIRLNSNGSIDINFTTTNGWLTAGIQSNNKVIGGGSFTQYGVQTRNGIIRLADESVLNDVVVFDEAGIHYGSDLSQTYTDRSLVDRGWVLSELSGLTVNLIGSGATTVTSSGSTHIIYSPVIPTLTATNGLSKSGNNGYKLGGILTGTTTILGASRTLNIGDSGGYLSGFNVYAGTYALSAGVGINIGNIGARWFLSSENASSTVKGSTQLQINNYASGSVPFVFYTSRINKNGIIPLMELVRASTGTTSNGIGTSIQFTTPNSSGTNRLTSISNRFTNVTNGAESTSFLFSGYRTGSTVNFFDVGAGTSYLDKTNGLVIGNTSLGTSSILELVSETKGFVLSRIGTEGNISSPVNGMIYYNTTNNKFRGYENGSWKDLI